ncbi:Vesicle transport v-SNARE 12 [Turnera subulata]|uniref:Vesicle transport v-SNARE 12 n=1 Tax=Turnera subulata TaxID=218843 RepID=A0A9Q0FSS7_9ROSI|nr:Vesicle transport v-SNARE 12 [Turnera subulata]
MPPVPQEHEDESPSSILQLHGVDDAIDKSKKVLTAMSRRLSRNKWIVGSVIAALVVAIIFIILLKISH